MAEPPPSSLLTSLHGDNDWGGVCYDRVGWVAVRRWRYEGVVQEQLWCSLLLMLPSTADSEVIPLSVYPCSGNHMCCSLWKCIPEASESCKHKVEGSPLLRILSAIPVPH